MKHPLLRLLNSIIRRPSPPAHRNRTARRRAVPALQTLERRLLLSADLDLTVATDNVVPGEEVAAEIRWINGNGEFEAQQQGEFGDLIGPSLFTVNVGLDNPFGGIFVGDSFEVFGQHDGQAAIDDGEVLLFDSIASSQGESGDPSGRIIGAQVLVDGSVIYLGQSAGPDWPDQPTFWFDFDQPFHPLFNGLSRSGELRASAIDGTFVGTSGFVDAAYGSAETNSLQGLPGHGANIALDISWDAELIVGGEFIWFRNEFGGYSVLDQSSFDGSQTAGLPAWRGVELDDTGLGYFGGNSVDVEQFVPVAAFFDEAGTHLGSFHGTFAGMAEVDGRVIAAVQGFDEGLLVDLSSGDVLTTTDLLGAPALFGSDTAIFSTEGGLGLLLLDEDGYFVSVHETSVTDAPNPGPELVDVFVDSNGDGEPDMFFPETDFEQFTLSFPRAGTYTVSVVAMDANLEEVASASQEVVVSAFRVENRDDANVLLVGADQEFGSTIRVIVRGGLTSVAVDDLEDDVSGDAPVSLVEVIGSPAADHVTLDGPFAASVDLRGGDDTLVIIGLSDVEVASGEELELFVADSPLQNALQPADVDGDGEVSPLDALLILNQLARSARDGLSGAEAFEQLLDDPNRHHYDVGGNGRIEPLDALLVLNHIARAARPPADGEDQPQQPPPPLDDQLVFTIATNTAVPGEMVAATVRWLSDNEPAAAQTGQQTGDFAELLGPSLLALPIELDNPLAATSFEGVVHVAGQHQGQAARQLIDLSTGTAGGVELFDSIASAQGSTGNTAGRINQVGVLDSGQVVYLGQSAGSLFSDQPTYWAQSTEPIHPLANGQSSSGELRAIAQNGTFVGTSGFVTAAYGNVQTNNMQGLPGIGANIALDISSDAEYILGGAFIWQANEIGGYGVFDTSSFEATPAGNNNPAWQAVAIDPVVGGAVFAGSYFDINSFTTKIGFWREDGSFIGASGDGTAFRDFAVVGDHLVAAVTDFEDSFLYSMSDFSSIALEDILGSKAVLAERGLFVHQPSSEPQTQEDHSLPIENELVGFVIQGADGPSVAISEVNPAEIFPPELVDIRVDSTGDGEPDMFFPETDFEQFTLTFPSAGTYTVSVVAVNSAFEEVASASQEVVVSAFRVENRDDANVLLVGADQEFGSTIRVIVRGGLTSVAVDDLEDEVSGDAPVSLVEVIGSPVADHVTLDGPFAASVDLRGGDDTLVIIGLSDFEVASGEELELFVADSPLQNALQPADVDGDGEVSPLDALLVLNQLARSARDGLSGAEAFEQLLDDPKRHHYDVGGNGRIEPLDALLVLNHIARAARPAADGENQQQQPQPPLDDQLVFTIATNTAVPGEMVAAEIRWLNGNGEFAQAGQQSGEFADLIGPSLFTVDVGLANPSGGLFIGDTFEVFGSHGGHAAIDDGEIIFFDSISSAQGDSGDPTGRIHHATELLDGSVVYVGSSAGSIGSTQPTFWFAPDAPVKQLTSVGLPSSGVLRAVSEVGVMVGTSGGIEASYAAIGNNFQTLPGFGAGLPRDITHDASLITGVNFIWQRNDLGGYDVFDTSGFEADDSGGVPGFVGVELDAQGRAYFGGNSFDLELFAPMASFYVDTGTFLGSFHGTFAGMAYVDGEVIAAVQGFDEGMLVRLSDGAVLTTTDLLGAPALFGSDTAIFSTEGGLGLLLWDDGDYFVSIHETTVTDNPNPGPELVDIRVDSTGDGEFDMFFPETDFETFTLSFPRAGTYTVSVVAVDANLEEVASASQEIVVSAFRVENRDDADVLLVGADQENGSTIQVIVRGGLTSVAVDDLEDDVSGDAPVSLVEVIGSPAADHVTLDGPFAASVDLRGGDDTLVIIGLSDFEVASGEDIELFVADSPLQNALQPADVDGDGNVSPLDALLILNQLARSARDGLSGAEAFEQLLDDPNRHHYDVGGNGRIEPLDALLVLNHIARAARPPADGEAPPLPLSLAAQRADHVLATTTLHWPVASADADRNNVSDDDERFPWGTPLF